MTHDSSEIFSMIHASRPDGKLEPLDRMKSNGRWGGMGPPQGNPYNNSNGGSNFQGGKTPFAAASRTPNPYADNGGKTPAWNASSRTPNPYADGSKTPAWNASSKTPNPYADGSKTPAWNASSRTPNPYASGSNNGGSSTWGGATPARTWGGATPGRSGWSSGGTGDGWGSPPRSGSSTWESTWVCVHFSALFFLLTVVNRVRPLLQLQLLLVLIWAKHPHTQHRHQLPIKHRLMFGMRRPMLRLREVLCSTHINNHLTTMVCNFFLRLLSSSYH